MKQYGLVKTLHDGDNEIKLCGNALTFVLYKSYFGRDLLNDIVEFAKKNAKPEAVEKLKAMGGVENITEDKAAELLGSLDNFTFDTEFILNFIASLMATALYPTKPDVVELITAIPPHFLTDNKVISELLDFLSLFISKKNG
jgi:hypothetical protein